MCIEVIPLPASNALRFKWGTGSSDYYDLSAVTYEKFVFLRGSPIIIGVSSATTTVGGVTSTTVTIAASVGGSTVSTASITAPAQVSPTQINLGNAAQTAVCPILCYGGRIDTANAKSSSDLVTSAQSLAMLYILTVPGIPGGLDNLG